MNMNTAPYLALHILNRVWSYLLTNGCRRDELRIVETLRNELYAASNLDPKILIILADIRLWGDCHIIPEVE